MSEDIKTKLLEYMVNIEAFACEQLPDAFQQFVKYKIVDHLFYSLMWLVVVLILALVSKTFHKRAKNFVVEGYAKGEHLWFGCILTGILSLSSFMGFIYQIKQTILVYVAPKAYLIEMLLDKGKY